MLHPYRPCVNSEFEFNMIFYYYNTGGTPLRVRTINFIGAVTEVDGVLVPPSRLVEYGTQHDTFGSDLSTRSTNHDGVTWDSVNFG